MARYTTHPGGLLAGFAAHEPSEAVRELGSIGEQWAPADFEIRAHVHRTWELYLQVDGSSLWQSGRRRFELGPGTGYIVGPDVTHRLQVRPTGAHHFYYAEVDIEPALRRHRELVAPWRRRAQFSVMPASALHDPFRQLVSEVCVDAPYRDRAIRLALDQLLLTATRLLGHGKSQYLLARHPAVARACQLIEREPGFGWNLQRLARASGSSPSHLSALFQRELGVSPHRYILNERLRLAKARLKDTDLSITQLAGDLGFSSSQHFAKMFKQHAGITARGFRQRFRRA